MSFQSTACLVTKWLDGIQSLRVLADGQKQSDAMNESFGWLLNRAGASHPRHPKKIRTPSATEPSGSGDHKWERRRGTLHRLPRIHAERGMSRVQPTKTLQPPPPLRRAHRGNSETTLPSGSIKFISINVCPLGTRFALHMPDLCWHRASRKPPRRRPVLGFAEQ